MPDNKSGAPVVQRSITSAEAIKKMEKELFREALMKDYDLKRGSKYPPMSIEPFPFERERLSGKYTDADRALRKQWLQDQILSDREPVHVERWARRNVFRRIWNAPFNGIERAMAGMGAPKMLTASVRFGLPKLVTAATAIFAVWLHTKVTPRSWEIGYGLAIYRSTAFSSLTVPGTPDWQRMMDGAFNREASSFEDWGYLDRKALRDERLLTSASGQQLDGSVQ